MPNVDRMDEPSLDFEPDYRDPEINAQLWQGSQELIRSAGRNFQRALDFATLAFGFLFPLFQSPEIKPGLGFSYFNYLADFEIAVPLVRLTHEFRLGCLQGVLGYYPSHDGRVLLCEHAE